ncbi:MAG: hypothetical protein QMD04_09135 [Anaerolineales bacterium]|nr:hypothetical protein [Anaerolineales bacterium]
MTSTTLFTLASQSSQEPHPELAHLGLSTRAADLTALEDVPATLESLLPGSIPQNSLMLGMAADGLPVLLNLYDLAPSPILVVGDRGSGKTAFLQLLARSVDFSQNPGDVQFGVVSNFTDEWSSLDASAASMGIWPAFHSSAHGFIHNMLTWADRPHHGRQVLILLLDDLASLVNASYEVQQDLRWLLLHGAEKRVWTVATLNTLRATRLRPWLGLFRTHIFGFIQQPALAQTLMRSTYSAGDAQQADLASLLPGLEFSLKQENGWLQFQIPAINL